MDKSNPIILWRETRKGYYIIGSKCNKCDALFLPYRKKCLKCDNELVDYRFKGTGKIYSYSKIYYAPAGFEKQVPYAVAIIQLDEGPKITAQIVDADLDKIEIGMRVEQCIRRIYADGESGIIHYGVKFRPIDSY